MTKKLMGAVALTLALGAFGGPALADELQGVANNLQQIAAQDEVAASPSAASDAPAASADPATSVAVDTSDPDAILDAIEADFETTQQMLTDEQTALFETVGNTYEGYLANVDAIEAWYQLAVSETEALGQRTVENGRLFYQALVDTLGTEDLGDLIDGLDDFYDVAYDGAFDDYYDVIYEDAFDAIYDQYYDGLLTDAADSGAYDDAYDVRSAAYDMWSKYRSDVYDDWSFWHSEVYSERSYVSEAFWADEFDIAKVLYLNDDRIGKSQPGVADPSAPVTIDENDPASVIAAIQADFSVTQQNLLDEQQALFEAVGDTFDGYVANEDAVEDWYDLVVDETEALGERTLENAHIYYQAVAATVDQSDETAVRDAMRDFEALIYDDAFDTYYTTIYEGAIDAANDRFYDGAIASAEDLMDYSDWYDVHSDAYEIWYDCHSDMYSEWYDARSDVYDEYYDVRSEFLSGNFDVADILRL